MPKKRIKINFKYAILLILMMTVVVKGYERIGMSLQDKAIMAMSGLLKNKTIVIDPGHGGYDPGKVGANGTKEKDLNLAIAKKLRDIFKKSGSKVILIREKDEDFSDKGTGGTKKKRDLDYRMEVVKNTGGQIYLNIQANSYGKNGDRWSGAQTFYNINNEEGKKLAESIQDEIKRQLQNTKRVALKMPNESSYILRNLTDLPATIIEVGFISNIREEKLLNDPAYQEQMAKAIHDGVIKYLMLKNEEHKQEI